MYIVNIYMYIVKVLLMTHYKYVKQQQRHRFYAPNFEKVGDILVLACPYVCVCVFVCIGHRDIRLETSCMDSSWKNSRRTFLVFPELSPLVKLRPFDKQKDEIL